MSEPIALLVITDGRRDCIARTIPAALHNLVGCVTWKIIYDDSGNAAYRAWLSEQFMPLGFRIMSHPRGRQGFGGAIQAAWDCLKSLGRPNVRFIFHLEDDFVLTRLIFLDDMVKVLDNNPHLVQLALRRQPWNEDERKAGGIVEQHPTDYGDCYQDCHYGRYVERLHWLEHRLFFTTNPSLYRRSLLDRGWPNVKHSEGIFTHQLLEDPAVRFGFWGSRESGESCHHIGDQRVGHGY